jgi:threonine dehydrogenase-like Zn-dependent dehydrogenase
MNCKAVVIEGPNSRPLLKEFQVPNVASRGALIVQMKACGVCGTDIHLWRGHIKGLKYPIIPGHENVGVVEKIGEGIETDILGNELSEGDAIVWPPGYSCGWCYYCKILNEPTLCPHRRSYGISIPCDEPPHLNGGFGEFIYLRPNTEIVKVPKGIPYETAALAGCAGSTVAHAVEIGQVSEGDVVVVQGGGGLGLFCIAFALVRGAKKVISIPGRRKMRLRLAEKFGADVIDMNVMSSVDERVNAVKGLTPGGYGADVIFECTGNPNAILEGLQMLRRGGRYVIVGQSPQFGDIPFPPSVITRNQLKLLGSWAGTGRHVFEALELIKSRKFPFNEMITHKFTLEEAAEALRTAEVSEEAVKVVIQNKSV